MTTNGLHTSDFGTWCTIDKHSSFSPDTFRNNYESALLDLRRFHSSGDESDLTLRDIIPPISNTRVNRPLQDCGYID